MKEYVATLRLGATTPVSYTHLDQKEKLKIEVVKKEMCEELDINSKVWKKENCIRLK